VKGTGAVDTATTTNTGASATYYVRVKFYSGRTGSTGTYSLKLN
jgi:serine protease